MCGCVETVSLSRVYLDCIDNDCTDIRRKLSAGWGGGGTARPEIRGGLDDESTWTAGDIDCATGRNSEVVRRAVKGAMRSRADFLSISLLTRRPALDMTFDRAGEIQYGDWVIVYHVRAHFPSLPCRQPSIDNFLQQPPAEPHSAHVGDRDTGQRATIAIRSFQAFGYGRETLGHEAQFQQRARFRLLAQTDPRTLVRRF